jgi:hypothetical protein
MSKNAAAAAAAAAAAKVFSLDLLSNQNRVATLVNVALVA